MNEAHSEKSFSFLFEVLGSNLENKSLVLKLTGDSEPAFEGGSASALSELLAGIAKPHRCVMSFSALENTPMTIKFSNATSSENILAMPKTKFPSSYVANPLKELRRRELLDTIQKEYSPEKQTALNQIAARLPKSALVPK